MRDSDRGRFLYSVYDKIKLPDVPELCVFMCQSFQIEYTLESTEHRIKKKSISISAKKTYLQIRRPKYLLFRLKTKATDNASR